ncbi:MAG: DUF4215 domain-containing protein [Nannocystaceae bacterium]
MTSPVMPLLAAIVASLALSGCTEPNPYLGICGNGAVEPDFGEECDDGDDNGDAEACTAACKLATCGDGLVQAGVEECDLGDLNSDVGDCTVSCAIKACGDGLVQVGEECDDGALNRWPPDGEGGCSIYCAKLPECGNGVVEGGEQCDDGNDDDDDACLSSCVLATCGDGLVQDGEECDDGNAVDEDACTSACAHAVCGDGIVHAGVEECDDGNDINSDACLTACLAAACGDGVLYEGVEECDDGNLEPDDGCNAECVADREVFVTAAPIDAASLKGIAGADALCQAEAEGAGLAEPERFRAWLSDSKSSPADRFETRNARYVLVDGSVIADDWEDLTDGQLSHPINRYLDGGLAKAAVWTSTKASGEAIDTPDFCGDWSVNDESFAGQGATEAPDESWTNLPILAWCIDIQHLYCFRD